VRLVITLAVVALVVTLTVAVNRRYRGGGHDDPDDPENQMPVL
jgi:hypothetical protein